MIDRPGSKISLGILAGGKSSRFGSEKHAATLDGVTLIRKVYRTAASLTDETLVSAGETVREFDIPGARVVVDRFQNAGPLAGMHACMESMQNDWLLVLACDLPFISQTSIASLLDGATHPNRVVVSRAEDGSTQPLCACYHRSILDELSRALEEERFGVYRFVASLDGVIEVFVPGAELVNVNRPEDLIQGES